MRKLTPGTVEFCQVWVLIMGRLHDTHRNDSTMSWGAAGVSVEFPFEAHRPWTKVMISLSDDMETAPDIYVEDRR